MIPDHANPIRLPPPIGPSATAIQVVGTLLLKDGGVFLAVRVHPAKNLPGYYCDAGGRIEKGEDVFQAALREIEEEASLKPREPLRYHGSAFVKAGAHDVEIHMCTVELRDDEVPVVPQAETDTLGPWARYSIDEALALPLVPGTRAALEQLQARIAM